MSTISATLDRARSWSRARSLKGAVLPILAAGLALAVAVIGAILTSSPSGGVVGGVEGLSSEASRRLGDVSLLLPFGIAFAAGMVSTVNPCGFPMLPAYLAMYVGSGEDAELQPSTVNRLGKAVLVGGVVTAGFVLLFGLAGVVIGAGARSVLGAVPWIGMSIGVLLALAGAWLLSGGKIYSGLAQKAAARIGDPTQVSVRGFFLFGIAYATASLSCTLPIFMAVTGISLASGGSLGSIGQFLLYALGMGSVILVLTLGIALFKGTIVKGLRELLPYIQPAGAGFMILAGAYIVFYWLTAGGLLNKPL